MFGDGVWTLIKNAFLNRHFDDRLLETLIVLISKVDVPTYVSQFHLISLCNVVYKLITKVLVNGLRPFLQDLIGSLQNSFIPSYSMTDNVIIN